MSDMHIICMSETWLRSKISDALVDLPGYKLFRRDRGGRHGGGVAFYLRENLSASILTGSVKMYNGTPEYIIAEIVLEDASNLLLAMVYRLPNVGHINEFQQLFLNLQANYRHSVIMGDFNADMASNSYDSAQINYFVASSNLYLVPYQTTHHLKASSTLLNLRIIDDASKLTAFGQHGVAFLFAHDLIFIKYNIKIRRRINTTINCRNYENFNEVDFLSEIQDIDWTQVWNSDCINRKVEVLNARLLECYNKHAPLQRIDFKNLPAPWITNELKAAMRERDMARRTWRRRRDDVSYQRFKILRNSVQSAVRVAKREYYLSAFVRSSNSNKMWSRLRHLGLVKKRSVNGPLQPSVDELNNYFVQSDEEVTMNNFDDLSLTLEQDRVSEDDFYWKYVTPSDIFTAVSRIKSSATGTDGIAPRLIKL
ncbi:uncharacterized protein LOC105194715 [Solenopsis invicta]|uniref:uncharacterized protein LOC105194715 n=1 Tax=Solenopsis invicta TaxID=13686 RepID=UPI000595FBE8|nr:uncharacterized protein LOC105194715 [Solenopsis invicta]